MVLGGGTGGGDSFTRRHDELKHELAAVLRWAHVQVDVEVYGQFAHLLNQAPAVAAMADRKRQGLVPDFRLEGKFGVQGLAELKFIGGCPSRYPVPSPWLANPPERPVDVRAAQILPEIGAKLRRNVGVPLADRVLTQLLQYGQYRELVVGAFGEMSRKFERLVRSIAMCRLRGPLTRRPGAGLVVSRIRKRLGVTALKAQANLIQSGLAFCGPGGAEAYERRGEATDQYRLGVDADRAEFFALHDRTHDERVLLAARGEW